MRSPIESKKPNASLLALLHCPPVVCLHDLGPGAYAGSPIQFAVLNRTEDLIHPIQMGDRRTNQLIPVNKTRTNLR